MTGELRSSAMLVHRPIGCGHWHVVLQRNTVVVLCLPMLSCVGDNPYLKQYSENWIQTLNFSETWKVFEAFVCSDMVHKRCTPVICWHSRKGHIQTGPVQV
jgi:hypothetical protein